MTNPWNTDDQAALLKSLADGTRLRLVRLLFREELNVQELGTILGVPQPTVSRHLGVLRKAGVVRDRRDGARVFYSLRLPPALQPGLRTYLEDCGRSQHPDLERLEEVLTQRASLATDFAERSAARWDDIGPLLHRSSALLTAVCLLSERRDTVADFGTGTGLLLPFLANLGERVLGIDQSSEMLRRARHRCEALHLDNVTFLHRPLEQLTPDEASCDAGLLHFVLHQVASPSSLLLHLHELVRPGGVLVIVDRTSHEDERAKTTFGSLWLGFDPEQVRRWLENAGFETTTSAGLPLGDGEAASTPQVFVLAARRN